MKITLNNLYKTYTAKKSDVSVNAVNGISLKIPSNEIFGIIGKSGAGKSTLVRLISMMERPDSGEVLYDDQRIDNLDEKQLEQKRRRIGMIFQNFNLFSSRTAGQNIAYPMEICGVPKAEIDKRVNELLEIVELSDRKDARISTLSGGQKQRIAIARALANKPDILFCDEATSALDPQTTKSILNLIRKIQSQMNLTVVMITHQMEVVRDACSHVAVIDNGEVIEQGSVSDIFLHPYNSVTKEFISNISQASKDLSLSSEDVIRWSKDGGAYKFSFPTQLQGEPILSQSIHKFNIDFNIRAAGVQRLTDETIGTMIADIIGEEKEVHKAIEYLQSEGLIVEKI